MSTLIFLTMYSHMCIVLGTTTSPLVVSVCVLQRVRRVVLPIPPSRGVPFDQVRAKETTSKLL